MSLPVDLVERVRFNPQLTKTWFGGIMELINQATILSVVFTGAALNHAERRRGEEVQRGAACRTSCRP